MDPFRDELGAAHSKIAELEKEKAELEARHQNEKQALEVRLTRGSSGRSEKAYRPGLLAVAP